MAGDYGDNKPDIHGHDNEHGGVVQKLPNTMQERGNNTENEASFCQSDVFVHTNDLTGNGGNHSKHEREDECTHKASSGVDESTFEEYKEVVGTSEKKR